jgi:nitrile hydratase subunit beta
MTQAVPALGEVAAFKVGDAIRVATRMPIGHYRVPTYLRGRRGVIAKVLQSTGVDNEIEGFGHNAGLRRHYYSIVFPMAEVWAAYEGQPNDRLQIEVFESWLERTEP